MKRILLLLALLLTAASQDLWAQARIISGRVLDDKGQPVINAGVTVKGTQSGTVTDIDGNFQLSLPEGSSNTLLIQYIGYANQEVAATNNMIVRLQAANRTLDETIVTANAIRREKRSLGYSTTQVTGNELVTGGNTSPLNALIGKSAGVNITGTANTPGSSSRIVLRGGSSIGNNNQALIVVDGVITNNSGFQTSGFSKLGNLSNQADYGNRANDINPEDIESISVLKGPAATALYGSQAANGALIITTKKGRRKATGPAKTEIEVVSAYTLSSILKLPEFQNSYGQGDLHAVVDDRRENFSWGLPFNDSLRPWGQSINGMQRVKPYSALEHNVRDFFDIGQTLNNNVAINGGNENSSFRLSLGSVNNKSIFPGLKYNRYTIGFNGSTQLSNKFYASVGVNYVKIDGDQPFNGQGASSIYNNLLQTPRDIPIRELRDLDNLYNSMDYKDSTGVQRYGYYGAYTTNPYYSLDQYRSTNLVDRVYGHITVGYQPTDWLRIENRLASDNYSDRRYQAIPSYSSIGFDPFYATNDPQTEPGRYSQDIYNVNNVINDLMATVTRDLTPDVTLNWQTGLNYSQYKTTNTFASTNEEGGLVVPGGYFLGNTNGKPIAQSDGGLVRRYGLYTDLSAGYRNTYFAGITARNDWSSTVSRSYLYYSANASLVVSEFFGEGLKKTWNYAKLRASFGSVGNDAGAYLDRTYYNPAEAAGSFGTTTFPFNGTTGFSYSNLLGNNNIQPEFTGESEIGTELAFFRNRLTLDFSYYSKESRNQILNTPTSAASGFTSTIINTGLIENKGVELALRISPVVTRNLRWELYGTYTKNVNEVKSLSPGVSQVVLGGYGGMSIVAAVGRPYGTFYTTGFNYTPDGKVLIDSNTGTPLVSKTAQYYGSYLPKFQASWGTTFTFKGFSLNVLFDMKQGGQFFSRTRDIMAFVGTSSETEDREVRVWDNSAIQVADGTYIPNTVKYDPYKYFTTNGLRPDAVNLVDASYVKLREARLSYLFPKTWFKRTFIGGASISAFGNNLFIWTHDQNKYADPEVNSLGTSNAQGFDFTAQPSVRNYGMELRFTF